MLIAHFAQLPLTQQVSEMFTLKPYLKQKIEQLCDLNGTTAEQGLLEVLRFMSLVNKYCTLTPSERVDQIWHQFILWTKLYEQYCTVVYGHFIHHTPDNNMAINQNQFADCLQRYRDSFGEPEARLWGRSFALKLDEACSGCESSKQWLNRLNNN